MPNFDHDLQRRRPSLDTHDYGTVFEAIAGHYSSEDPDCLVAGEAIKAGKKARDELKGFGLPKDAIEDMFYDAGREVREMHAWLSLINPEDFGDPNKWL